MEINNFEIESSTRFSESLIWQLNRDFYEEKGISAWSDDIVPHHMTSSASVGKTYAELLFAFLKDLAAKGKTTEVVYILELGAGHGRLAFHILKHLQKLVDTTEEQTPPFCYVLSDIIEGNLSFFQDHPQLQNYFEAGVLDLAYFDAFKSEEILLRTAQKTIHPKDLKSPIIAIANYFFDSLPNELFFIQDKEVSACSVAINASEDPKGMDTESLIKQMTLTYSRSVSQLPIYEESVLNDILEEYRHQLSGTYLFFPAMAMKCLQHLKDLSGAGLVLLTMDKGFHELQNLKGTPEPEIITHGSFSLWVNYHALNAYCSKQGGKGLFPYSSNFHLEIGCLMFLAESETYPQTDAAYQQFVNNFGPDDFNTIKQLTYSNLSRLKTKELLALYRLSAYDSTFFIKLLPRLKQTSKSITINERRRLAQALNCVWDMYFNINERLDLAYELGGLFYDLGYYVEALAYFQHSIDSFGSKADTYYNRILCFYQLRQDQLFYKTLTEAKQKYPQFELFQKLDNLDMA
ncbi:MAG: SAM-dependent methyltransferase [Saprospiraceae bacterium]|nr:SAM-dependent methyltransferase [Saprospiraceae bacterium]